MASINITNQKFTPGPLPKVYAARAELLVLLSKAAEKKIVYVSASAGSGKTVGAFLWTDGLILI